MPFAWRDQMGIGRRQWPFLLYGSSFDTREDFIGGRELAALFEPAGRFVKLPRKQRKNDPQPSPDEDKPPSEGKCRHEKARDQSRPWDTAKADPHHQSLERAAGSSRIHFRDVGDADGGHRRGGSPPTGRSPSAVARRTSRKAPMRRRSEARTD